ncbi:hypothetical protein GCM10020000_65870 [Streptomyces olivoverticillatus]
MPTKDGHLVCRHENDITATTDVSKRPEFASRKTTKTVDGEAHTGWFTEDFTLAELKTLRAVERLPQNRQHNTLYDGRWDVPTFEEVLKWADEQGRKRGRRIWLHTETKHPTYFRKLGLGLEEPLAKLLRRYGSAPCRLGAVPGVLRAEQPPAAELSWVSTARRSSCWTTSRPGRGTSSRPRTRAPSPTSSRPRGSSGSPASPRASARGCSRSSRATPRASSASPPPSSATRMPPG